MIDLKRVRVFFEVAERRSFSAAAAALQYTQPSVSHHVAALERELGQRLINRSERPLTLTQAGERLHLAASVALAEIDRAELDLRALAQGGAGRVALGSVVTGLRSVVPPAVSAFRERFPGIELALEESQPAEVLGRLRSGQLDVGIVSLTEEAAEPDPALFASVLLAEQPMLAAVASTHRLARRRQIGLNAMRDEHWLLPSPARFPEYRTEVDELLAQAGVVPKSILEFTDDIAGARLIAAGAVVALTPWLTTIAMPGVTVIPLRPAVRRRLYAVTIAGDLSMPVRVLLDELRAAARLIRSAG
jgi:DNA-binding transcriptional LysR family regulator